MNIDEKEIENDISIVFINSPLDLIIIDFYSKHKLNQISFNYIFVSWNYISFGHATSNFASIFKRITTK
jgi:hypothetical protein